jgi:hypothetical protein
MRVILIQGDTAELSRKLGVREQACYRWKQEYWDEGQQKAL